MGAFEGVTFGYTQCSATMDTGSFSKLAQHMIHGESRCRGLAGRPAERH